MFFSEAVTVTETVAVTVTVAVAVAVTVTGAEAVTEAVAVDRVRDRVRGRDREVQLVIPIQTLTPPHHPPKDFYGPASAGPMISSPSGRRKSGLHVLWGFTGRGGRHKSPCGRRRPRSKA